MSEYGSVGQTKRRRRKYGGISLHVYCECSLPWCEHKADWDERNRHLLNIRNPYPVGTPISSSEIVRIEADR